MINVSTLTDEQIKHIAKLASNDDFSFDNCEIERTDTRVKISEASGLTRQEICIGKVGVIRRDYDLEQKSYSPRYIYNIIELGKYLETNTF